MLTGRPRSPWVTLRVLSIHWWNTGTLQPKTRTDLRVGAIRERDGRIHDSSLAAVRVVQQPCGNVTLCQSLCWRSRRQMLTLSIRQLSMRRQMLTLSIPRWVLASCMTPRSRKTVQIHSAITKGVVPNEQAWTSPGCRLKLREGTWRRPEACKTGASADEKTK